MCEGREKRLKFFPNQALYQAEPQPELIVNPARQGDARSYFAYFEAPGKKLSPARLYEIGAVAPREQFLNIPARAPQLSPRGLRLAAPPETS